MALKRLAVDFSRGPAAYRPLAWAAIFVAGLFLGAELGALAVELWLRVG